MFCPKCGNQMEDGVKFCGRCGAFIETENNQNVNEDMTQTFDSQDYSNQSYADSGYQNQAYQNTGYQNAEYQNQAYQNTGYQTQGYQNQGYQNQYGNNAGYAPVGSALTTMGGAVFTYLGSLTVFLLALFLPMSSNRIYASQSSVSGMVVTVWKELSRLFGHYGFERTMEEVFESGEGILVFAGFTIITILLIVAIILYIVGLFKLIAGANDNGYGAVKSAFAANLSFYISYVLLFIGIIIYATKGGASIDDLFRVLGASVYIIHIFGFIMLIVLGIQKGQYRRARMSNMANQPYYQNQPNQYRQY